MQLADISFYIFSIVVISSALLVVVSRNPVHSVLWLILMFLSSACLFVLLGAEFVAMLLIIVYVGAVAVLFLFVVMMLDIDFSKLKSEFVKYMPVAGLICVVLLMELSLIFGIWQTAETAENARASITPDPLNIQNTVALGKIVYSKYIYLFQIAGLILLVAMIGAIVLTLRHRDNVRRQDISSQVSRDQEKNVELKDITFEESE